MRTRSLSNLLVPRRRAPLLLSFASGALLAACSGGGGDGDGAASPVYDSPVGDNGVFQFVPGPPGTAPGLRVVATVDGQTFESAPAEVILRAYETFDVERKAGDAPPAGDEAADSPFPGIDRLVRELPVREPAAQLEPVPVRFDDEVRVVPRPDALRPERRVEGGLDLLAGVRDADLEITEEVERFHTSLQRALHRLAPLPEGAPRPKNGCEGDIVPFSRHAQIGTFDGRTFWVVQTFGIERYGMIESYAWALHFAPEGLYASLQYGVGQGLPSNTIGLSINTSLGFGISEGAGRFRLSGGDLEGLSLGVSFSLSPFHSVGWTMFVQNPPFGLNNQIQFDHGFDIAATLGLGFGPLFFSWPVSLSYSLAQFATRGGAANQAEFVFVRGWRDRCGFSADRDVFGAPGTKSTGTDALAALTERMEGLAQADDGTFYNALGASAGAAALPLIRSLTVAGAPPAQGVPGSTNGAVIADFLDTQGNEVCDDCADHSLAGGLQRTFRNVRVAGEDGGRVFEAAIDSAATYRRILPDPSQLSNLSERAVGSIDAAFAIVFEEGADLRQDPNRYVDQSVVTIEANAGEEFDLVYTLEEIAEVVGATRDEVFGATICLAGDFSGPRLEDTCVEFTDDFLRGTLRMPDATTLLVGASVDLSTAAGYADVDTSGWQVELAIRRVVNRPNRPVRVALSAPFEAWSGSPVSLTAVITDDKGNIVDVEADYVFFDGNGEELGRASTDYGGATLQTILTPVTPSVSGFRSADLIGVDGERFSGWIVEGTGLGRETDVEVDGTSLLEAGYTIGAIDDRTMGIVDEREEATPALLSPGSVRLVAVSPGGEQRSRAFTARVESPGGEATRGTDASRVSAEELEERLEP